MKAIRVAIDEDLLAKLDADEEVRRVGRSEVVRRAVAAYLHGQRTRVISERYRKGYRHSSRGLGEEAAGWENEGRWPSD